jgi:hypothetical protein
MNVIKKINHSLKTMSCDKITRVEVIDDSGRAYVKWDIDKVLIDIQDDGRTLKVFVGKPIGTD